jgi:hypothetical protein
MALSPFCLVSIPRQSRGLFIVAKETTTVEWQCYRLLNNNHGANSATFFPFPSIFFASSSRVPNSMQAPIQ